MSHPATPAEHLEVIRASNSDSVFARNVRVELARQNITIDALAALIRPEGVHPTWIRRRLALGTATSLFDLDRIAAALGTTAVALITPADDRSTFIPGSDS